jgi:hypothetical protein
MLSFLGIVVAFLSWSAEELGFYTQPLIFALFFRVPNREAGKYVIPGAAPALTGD